MKTIEFKISKKKTIFLVIAGMLFVIVSFLFLFFPHIFQSFLIGNLLLIRFIGLIGFLFFGFVLVLLIKKVFFGKIGIIINEIGIIDNSSYVSVGVIKWEDIKSIEKREVASTRFLLIYVQNPKNYIDKNKNKIKIKLLKANNNSYGTPISISSNFIDCHFEILEETIRNSFSEYKKSNM